MDDILKLIADETERRKNGIQEIQTSDRPLADLSREVVAGLTFDVAFLSLLAAHVTYLEERVAALERTQ